MPIPAVRVIETNDIRNFGSIQGTFEISDLTRIQTDSYVRFLQLEADARERKDEGLEAILREVFRLKAMTENTVSNTLNTNSVNHAIPNWNAASCV